MSGESDAECRNRAQELTGSPRELYRQEADWVTFFRKILGVDGVVRRCSPRGGDVELEQTQEYAEIQQMLAKLRERGNAPTDDNEPTRVITVRLPKSLHESLRTEAHEKRTSMNKLCISKLLQMVDEELIPRDYEALQPAGKPRDAERHDARPESSGTAELHSWRSRGLDKHGVSGDVSRVLYRPADEWSFIWDDDCSPPQAAYPGVL